MLARANKVAVPILRMFIAAFRSRSCWILQLWQYQSRTDRSMRACRCPHSWLTGIVVSQRPMVSTRLPRFFTCQCILSMKSPKARLETLRPQRRFMPVLVSSLPLNLSVSSRQMESCFLAIVAASHFDWTLFSIKGLRRISDTLLELRRSFSISFKKLLVSKLYAFQHILNTPRVRCVPVSETFQFLEFRQMSGKSTVTRSFVSCALPIDKDNIERQANEARDTNPNIEVIRDI